MNSIHKGLMVLLRSAVTGEKMTLPEDFSPEAAWPIIKAQGLTTLVYAGAINCGLSREEPFLKKIWPHYLRHALHGERQMAAVKAVLGTFEENGIDYLPLKGCVMKPMYPAPELRVMGDADILIRQEQYERIIPMVEAMGFRLNRTGQHEYEWRNDVLVLELHQYMISPAETDLFSFFGTGWERAVRQEGSCWCMTLEDMWIFLFAHMAKHYRNCGIGSRHMVDLYVFRRTHPELNESQVEAAMKKLGLLEFYRNILRLLEVWFGDAPADPVTEFITEYVFSGGSFGLPENGVQTEAVKASGTENQIRGSRIRTVLRKLFPRGKSFENRYPILKRFPVLYPILWLWRWIDVLLHRPGRIKSQIRIAANTTDEKVLARQQALRFVGLELLPEDNTEQR